MSTTFWGLHQHLLSPSSLKSLKSLFLKLFFEWFRYLLKFCFFRWLLSHLPIFTDPVERRPRTRSDALSCEQTQATYASWDFQRKERQIFEEKKTYVTGLSIRMNKAAYTASSVACFWAGAVTRANTLQLALNSPQPTDIVTYRIQQTAESSVAYVSHPTMKTYDRENWPVCDK